MLPPRQNPSRSLLRLFAPRQACKQGFWRAAALIGLILGPDRVALADAFHQASAAYAGHNYTRAAQIFSNLAARGDPRAQTFLGFMYANGEGVPQNFIVAAGWYHCAVNQGFASAEYLLGLQYDKGQGVPQNFVKAYALLNLAVAGAGPERHYWVKIRDAVESKLSLAERVQSQQMAFVGPPQQPCLPIHIGN